MSASWILRVVTAFAVFGGLHFAEGLSSLTPLQLAKSITSYGDLGLYANVFSKLSNQRCLNLTAIGGSVTVGHFNHTMIPKEFLWPTLLVNMLNEQFPCSEPPGGHRVKVLARGGTSTNQWIQELAGRQEEVFRSSDWVLLETAVNQMADRGVAQQEAETLLSMITLQSRRVMTQQQLQQLELQQQTEQGQGQGQQHHNRHQRQEQHQLNGVPVRGFTGTAAMWVVASTRTYSGLWSGVPYERQSDAMYAQLPVALHHGVPIVSALDAVGPFRSESARDWFNRTWYGDDIGAGDGIHPGRSGHAAIAQIIMRWLNLSYEHVRIFQGYEMPGSYVPRPPLFVDGRTRDMYLDANPVSIYLLNGLLIQERTVPGTCRGWGVYEDVPNKYGFIVKPAGRSECVLYLRPEEVRRISVRQVYVALLKSYDRMGVLDVTITAGSMAAVTLAAGGAANSNGGGGGSSSASSSLSCAAAYNPAAPALGSTTIDCLWSERASVAQVETFSFTAPPAVDNTTCLFVSLVVRPTKRKENKVKLMSLSFF